MTAQFFLAAAFVVMIASALLLAAVDSACQSKADKDFARWADDAIDLTGGAR